MDFSEINPFLRFAQLQPTIIEGNRYKAAYDYRIFYILSGTAAAKPDAMKAFNHPGNPCRKIPITDDAPTAPQA